MKKLFLFMAVFLIAISCSQNEQFNEPGLPPGGQRIVSNFPDELAGIRDDVVAGFSLFYPELGESITTGDFSLTVDYYTTETLRQVYPSFEFDVNDTIFYLVNVSNRGGFMILSPDSGVVAVSNSGNLNLPDFYHPVTDEWASEVGPVYPITTLVDMYALWTFEGNVRPRPYEEPYEERDVGAPYFAKLVGPMLCTYMHQEAPYNSECHNMFGQSMDAGCVAIALTQLCAYHNLPESVSYLNTSINCLWPQWITSSQLYYNFGTINENMKGLASCIELIGRKSGIQYWLGQTGTTSWLTKECLRCMNGYVDVDLVDMNVQNQQYLHFLNTHRPFICTADNAHSGTGHAWVIDGYAAVAQDFVRVYSLTGAVSDVFTRYSTKVNCNWGWGRNFDGYYSAGLFALSTIICNIDGEYYEIVTSNPSRYCENVQQINYSINN